MAHINLITRTFATLLFGAMAGAWLAITLNAFGSNILQLWPALPYAWAAVAAVHLLTASLPIWAWRD